MTKISEENLLHLAHLCRIACSKEKRAELLQEFQQIVSYIDLLSEVNTDTVDACNYVTEGHAETPLREDVIEESLSDFMDIVPKAIASLVEVPIIFKSE